MADPLPLVDTDLLYIRLAGRTLTVSLTVDDKRETVYLAHGTREAPRLYQVLRERTRRYGLEEQPWPEDALTVPHNQW